MALHRVPKGPQAGAELSVNPVFTREGEQHAPKHRLGDEMLLAETAYQLVHDEVMMDGNARFNLATFVTTWMPPEADKLIAESVDKNMIDKDEYPQTAEIERRCVAMIADLWNAPESADAIGVSCTGSSEACMLGGLALKRRWQNKMRAAGKPTDKPNIVFGQNVQVVWEKFANYWEVEPRYVPLEGDVLHMTADRMLPFVDENTIGVVPILGSTFDGSFEPINEIAAALDKLAATGGPDVPIHVDAASGGFVAPFIHTELAPWDFRLERVASISSSGHKYGLVYPGVGWVVWRTPACLPEELIFNVNYLGGNMPTFALNFSRPGSQVIAQYFMFLRLGREGYREVQKMAQEVAQHIARSVEELGVFDLITDGSELPVVAFSLKPEVTKYTVYDVSRKLREKGWLVPAYSMPPNRTDLDVLRVVVRLGVSHDMAELFSGVLKESVEWLDDLDGPLPQEETQAFAH